MSWIVCLVINHEVVDMISLIDIPEDITYEQKVYSDYYEFIFKHRDFGKLGRLVLRQLPNDYSQVSLEISGHKNSDVVNLRKKLLMPLNQQLMDILNSDNRTGKPIAFAKNKKLRLVIRSLFNGIKDLFGCGNHELGSNNNHEVI